MLVRTISLLLPSVACRVFRAGLRRARDESQKSAEFLSSLLLAMTVPAFQIRVPSVSVLKRQAQPCASARNFAAALISHCGGGTCEIPNAKSIRDLLVLHTTHHDTFNEIDVSETWQMIRKLRKPRDVYIVNNDLVDLMADLERTTVRVLVMAGAREAAKIAHGVAHARYYSASIFNAVAEKVEERLEDFVPLDLAMTIWAFATVGHAAPKLFVAVAEKAEECLEDFKPHELANTAWAFAVLNHPLTELFHSALVKKCEDEERFFESIELSQLHQWNLWQIERGMQPRLSAEMQARCLHSFCSEFGKISNFQTEIMLALRKLGVTPVEEVRTILGYSLDGIVTWRDCKIAIEVDGPSHFIGDHPSGATLLKRRQLRSLGAIKLCPISYREWTLCRTNVGRQELLRERLNLALDEDMSSLRVVDLKDRLRTFGLKVSGRKAELCERLMTGVFCYGLSLSDQDVA